MISWFRLYLVSDNARVEIVSFSSEFEEVASKKRHAKMKKQAYRQNLRRRHEVDAKKPLSTSRKNFTSTHRTTPRPCALFLFSPSVEHRHIAILLRYHSLLRVEIHPHPHPTATLWQDFFSDVFSHDENSGLVEDAERVTPYRLVHQSWHDFCVRSVVQSATSTR